MSIFSTNQSTVHNIARFHAFYNALECRNQSWKFQFFINNVRARSNIIKSQAINLKFQQLFCVQLPVTHCCRLYCLSKKVSPLKKCIIKITRFTTRYSHKNIRQQRVCLLSHECMPRVFGMESQTFSSLCQSAFHWCRSRPNSIRFVGGTLGLTFRPKMSQVSDTRQVRES